MIPVRAAWRLLPRQARAASPPAAGPARRGAWPAARPARRLAGKYLLSASGLTSEYHPLASSTQRIAICRLCHSAFWEYNIIHEHDLAPHVAAGVRLKFQSGNPSRPALFNSGLRARFACRAAFTRFIHAHELTSRALRRGRVRYHRAARILNRWAVPC